MGLKIKAFDSAYPGSMFEKRHGGYVERDDPESLAAALLALVKSGDDAANDAQDRIKQLEEQLNAARREAAEAQARERDLHSYALKLSLDAECMWLDCKNNIVVSRWMAPLFESINNVKQFADANEHLALDAAIDAARKGGA